MTEVLECLGFDGDGNDMKATIVARRTDKNGWVVTVTLSEGRRVDWKPLLRGPCQNAYRPVAFEQISSDGKCSRTSEGGREQKKG